MKKRLLYVPIEEVKCRNDFTVVKLFRKGWWDEF